MKVRVKNILCLTNFPFESTADSALPYSIALSLACEAKLLIRYSESLKPPASSEDQECIKQELSEEVTKRIARIRSNFKNWEGIALKGNPAKEILREAAERHADLIVIDSHRRLKTKTLLDPTVEAICRLAPCPVLTTHSQEREWIKAVAEDITLKRILVAYDFSNDSELALKWALSLAQKFQTELHLLHVISPSLADEAFDQASQRLKLAIPAEAELECHIKRAIRTGKVYREILDYAADQQIDLICMGQSGAGFGMGALFGSNSDRVLRQAPCSVLITRPLKPLNLISI